VDRDRRALAVLPDPSGAPDPAGYALVGARLRLRFRIG
jgi:hypothetical protein